MQLASVSSVLDQGRSVQPRRNKEGQQGMFDLLVTGW